MDISFDYYKVFYEVARCQNITQAALNLCLTQPTVTKYIHNLEDMLQCKLFNRSQKGVTLTDEGRILFRQINRPCQQMGRAEELLKEYDTLREALYILLLPLACGSFLCYTLASLCAGKREATSLSPSP